MRAAGEPDDFWVKNYLDNGLRLPKMQKIYIKMFGSNATFFLILSFTADNTKSFALKATVFQVLSFTADSDSIKCSRYCYCNQYFNIYRLTGHDRLCLELSRLVT